MSVLNRVTVNRHLHEAFVRLPHSNHTVNVCMLSALAEMALLDITPSSTHYTFSDDEYLAWEVFHNIIRQAREERQVQP